MQFGIFSHGEPGYIFRTGWPSEREDCFTLARQSERRRAEWHAQRVATAVAKATKTKTKLPKPTKQEAPASLPAAVQMELF